MIETLISSKTRIKLLMKFFINSKATGYLRSLENEFGESSNGIRLELNKFEDAGLLSSKVKGNKKHYQANTEHPLFEDIHNIVLKHIGIDQIIENIIARLGNVELVLLSGDFAKGVDSPIIDLIIVGDINQSYLVNLTKKAESFINRKIRYLAYSISEYEKRKIELERESLIIWEK